MRIAASLLAIAAATVSLPIAALAQSDRASPELSARVEGVVGEDSKDLAIAQLDVAVVRRGGTAVTTMTVRFDNPSDQTLEGQFGLTMPEGSVVTGYALDVGGQMIDGVLQPRDRAREAFERRVVRRIDPGLAEVDYSNRFETRVYPIFPRQGRTIRIEFATPLDAQGRYRLPIDVENVGQMSLRVEGATPARIAGVDWREEGGAYTASIARRGLDGTIGFDTALDNGITVSRHPGEGDFFELVGEIAPTRRAPIGGQDLTILWDRSVSRLDDDLNAEIALLERLVRESDPRSIQINFFDSRGVDRVAVRPNQLARTLRDVRYVGGTGYSGLAAATQSATGQCVLFTDGRATTEQRAGLGQTDCRVHVVTSGGEADKPWLEALAARHGGAFVDLGALDEGAAIGRLLAPRRIPQVTDGDKNPVEVRVLPSRDGRYRIVGPMPRGGLMVDGRPVPTNRMAVPTFAGPGALWASQHLSVVRDSMDIEALAAEARRWSVATPGVSFIVLETPGDYVESGFEPPQTYPKDQREQYEAIKRQQDANDARADTAYYQSIVQMWEERKAWWSGKPMPQPRPQPVVRTTNQAMVEEQGDRLPPPPPPPPPPAPQAVAPPPPDSRNERAVSVDALSDESIVVTGAAAADSSAEAQFASSPDGEGTGIDVGEWSANRPYIARWDAAGEDWQDAVAETEKEEGDKPLFYLDLAEWHFANDRREEALRAAEAALELPARDNRTLAIVAQRLLRYGDPTKAIYLLDLLTTREAAQPGPWLALAQAYVARGKATGSRADLAKALELMTMVGLKRWPGEFQRVNEYALAEANALIVMLGGADAPEVSLDPKFIDALPLDVRVVAQWNTPRTDLDLWVREPSGEDVGYSNRSSRAGGRYLHDITQGFGPEEYAIRKTAAGTYRIEVNTFRADTRDPNGPSTVTVRLIRDFAKPTQREETIDVELQPDETGRRLIGTIEID